MSYDRASTLQIQNNVLDLVLKILLLGSIKNYLIANHKINSFEYWSGSSLYKIYNHKTTVQRHVSFCSAGPDILR